MGNGLLGLRHNTIIGRHDQYDDIGCVRTPRPHRSKGLMTRSVQKCNHATRGLHMIGTNMLRNPPGLACCDLGSPNVIE